MFTFGVVLTIAVIVFMAFIALIAINSRHNTNADLGMHLSEAAAASLGSQTRSRLHPPIGNELISNLSAAACSTNTSDSERAIRLQERD
jgi:hypothetical protein